MKQSFARQHSHHHDRTPSALSLPVPQPPVAAKRPDDAADAAIALPDAPEPLVPERTEIAAAPAVQLSRQARRRALRAEAKARRRLGVPSAAVKPKAVVPAPAPVQTTVAPVEAEPPAALELDIVAPNLTDTVAQIDADRPLPSARALVAAKPRGLALVADRVRGLFGFRRTASVTEGAIAGQLRTLRKELASLQKSIDRMLDAAV